MPDRLYAGEAQIARAGPGSCGFPRVVGLARSSNLAPVQLLFSGSTSDSKIKQSGVAKPLASTTGADICAYRAATAFDRPDLLDANAQAPRRAPRMAGAALLAQLVEHLHGKEGVDGSSPSEGFDE